MLGIIIYGKSEIGVSRFRFFIAKQKASCPALTVFATE